MADKPKQIAVEFYSGFRENKRKSAELGRVVCDDVEMCRIRWYGDKNRDLHAPAHDQFKFDRATGRHLTYAEAFPDHYKAFKANQAQPEEGTPIEHLPFLTKGRIAELKAQNIRTAEALANLPDRLMQKVGMDGHMLRNQAKAWIDDADRAASLGKATAENDALRKRIEQLEKLMMQQSVPQDAPEQEEVAADDPESWTDDQLRGFLKEKGIPVRANQARDKLVAAVREMMGEEAVEAA